MPAATKLGVIQNAAEPMLGFTNPNAQVDLRRVWLDTYTQADDLIWLYFAWERDSSNGSGVIMFEFQQNPAPLECDYSVTDQVTPITPEEQTLINSCNPWENRSPGDFIIIWDQAGKKIVLEVRKFVAGTDTNGNNLWDKGEPLVLQTSSTLAPGSWDAEYSADRFRGEAAINLSATVFPAVPDSCFSVANIIPGTVTGNSDTADYKDTVLADYTEDIEISNCGALTVEKVTSDGGAGAFPYSVDRSSGDALFYPGDAQIAGSVSENQISSILDTSDPTEEWTEDWTDLRIGDDYQLAEGAVGPVYALDRIECIVDGDTAVPYVLFPLDDPDYSSTFPVEASSITHCTITNQLQPGTLVVKKVVINDDGGTKAATDFSFSVNGGTAAQFVTDPDLNPIDPLMGKNSLTVNAGGYTITEPEVEGYTTSYDNCEDVNVAAGGTTTCTITNDDDAPTLSLVKVVVNDNGGSALASAWTLTATSASDSFSDEGAQHGTLNQATYGPIDVVANEEYTLSESGGPSGYSPSSWSCSIDGGASVPGDKITLSEGQSGVCTITNDDQSGTLIVKKLVVNDSGGSKVATDFSFSVNGGAAVAFLTDPVPNPIDPLKGKNTLTVNAGNYTITEPAVSGYSPSYNNCTNVTVPNGGSATCTITNDDQAATLIVRKVVINDNGGTNIATDFSFSVNGAAAVAFLTDPVPNPSDPLLGKNTLSVAAGNYSIVEPDVDGYTTSYNNCTNVAIANGATATCTITNDDEKADPAGTTEMSWVLHDSLTITGLRHGAADAGQCHRHLPPVLGYGSALHGAGRLDEIIDLVGSSAATVNRRSGYESRHLLLDGRIQRRPVQQRLHHRLWNGDHHNRRVRQLP